MKMGKDITNAGRVPLWAISFDRLLEDPEGVKYLTVSSDNDTRFFIIVSQLFHFLGIFAERVL